MNKNWIIHLPWDTDSAFRMGGAAGRKESYYQTLIKNTMCLARAVVQNVRFFRFIIQKLCYKTNVLSFLTRLQGCPNTGG